VLLMWRAIPARPYRVRAALEQKRDAPGVSPRRRVATINTKDSVRWRWNEHGLSLRPPQPPAAHPSK
jgi:hypothetical protein